MIKNFFIAFKNNDLYKHIISKIKAIFFSIKHLYEDFD